MEPDGNIVMRETTDLFILLTDLEAFTVYDVSVAAFTIATGPSNSASVRTDSDGEYH